MSVVSSVGFLRSFTKFRIRSLPLTAKCRRFSAFPCFTISIDVAEAYVAAATLSVCPQVFQCCCGMKGKCGSIWRDTCPVLHEMRVEGHREGVEAGAEFYVTIVEENVVAAVMHVEAAVPGP
jgi:hypothetical protein